MNFDDKYPNIKLNELIGEHLKYSEEEEECEICQEYTQWQYINITRNAFGFPVTTKKHVCSDNCYDYYDIMKGLM